MGRKFFICPDLQFIYTSFSAMKHLNLNNSNFGGAAPPGDAEMRCA